jgi:hypothetical protein
MSFPVKKMTTHSDHNFSIVHVVRHQVCVFNYESPVEFFFSHGQNFDGFCHGVRKISIKFPSYGFDFRITFFRKGMFDIA